MIGLIGASILLNQQMHTMRGLNSNDESELQIKKKQYYKLLNFEPMIIKLNVASHGNRFLPQLVNISMIKEIRGGYMDIYGLSPDKWCVAKFIDDNEIWIEGSLDEIQSKIWREEEINKKIS